MENQFYSKVCVVASIKSAIDEARRSSTHLQVNDRFSHNLETILARKDEVVAVRLITSMNNCTVYISKSGAWLKKDHEYIEKIKRHLRSISEDAPMSLKSAWKRDDVRALFSDVMAYCTDKLEKRFNKLMDDISRDRNKNHIMSFKSFMIRTSSIDVNNLDNVERHVISRVCAEYYKKVKKSSKIPEKFLRHVRKVGSYLGSLINIVRCVCKEFHKGQIANLELKKLKPIKTCQTISSWILLSKVLLVPKNLEISGMHV